MNDPNEMLQHLKPFFPDDFSLAKNAVSKLFPSIPIWVVEMIVFEFFQVMGTQAAFREYIKKSIQYDDVLMGPSRDLIIPDDLSYPISLN